MKPIFTFLVLLAGCAELDVPYLTPSDAGTCDEQVEQFCQDSGYLSYQAKPGYAGCIGVTGAKRLQDLPGSEQLDCIGWSLYGGKPGAHE